VSEAPDPQTSNADESGERSRRHAAYWSANIRIVLALLIIWFGVSYGCGVLLVDQLNKVRLPGTGFPLGFWFAQQGAIYAFVVLIWVYVVLMNRLDRKYGVDERSAGKPEASAGDAA